MSLYRCESCGFVENTALANYHHRAGGPALCSECDPAIKKWHGRFPRIQADGNYVPGPFGLMSLEEAEQKWAEDESSKADELAKRISLKNLIEGAFRRGWNYGAAYQRGELGQKPKEKV